MRISCPPGSPGVTGGHIELESAAASLGSDRLRRALTASAGGIMESTGGSAAAPAKHTDSSVGESDMEAMRMATEGHQPENGFVSSETTTPAPLTRIDQCVLPFLGGFGRYQKQLILLTWIPALFIGAIQFSDNFLLDQPNSTCVQPVLNASAPTSAPSALSERLTNNGTRGDHIYNNGAHGTDSDVDHMRCNCSEWKFKLHTGLVQNVVTKSENVMLTLPPLRAREGRSPRPFGESVSVRRHPAPPGGLQGVNVAGLFPSPKWSLVCDSASEVHIAKFALVVGSSFGYLVFGILADWFGRHPMLIISVLSMLAFGLSVAFSVNVPMFSILRFFEGFSLAGIILSLYLLRIEICLPEWRFSMNMVTCFLMLAGQLLMPVVAYLCRDWQVLQVAIICPLVLMLSYIWVFPESLRWLLATQQYYRSNWIMERIAKKNKGDPPADGGGGGRERGEGGEGRGEGGREGGEGGEERRRRGEGGEGRGEERRMRGEEKEGRGRGGGRERGEGGRRRGEEKERRMRGEERRGEGGRRRGGEGRDGRAASAQVLFFAELQRVLHIKPKRKCIMTMVGTRNLWKNIVVLCLNSLTGFGIHYCFVRSLMDPEGHNTIMSDNFYVEFYTKAVITVASCLVLCPAVGLMGRRGGLLMFMIITALASLLQLGLLNLLGKYSGQLNIDSSDTLNKNLSLSFSIIGMFSSYGVSILSIFICAEITPTVIRGGGLGLVLASAGFGMLTGPIMDLHNQKGYFLHHIIFACCTLICIICILLLPETRRHPLPETLADGETYNRQTLLKPRKSGEQRFLLGPSKNNRDYSRVQDMALQEAATTVISTMESTASSAVDLTILSTADMTAPALVQVHPNELEPKDPNGRSPSSLSGNPVTDPSEDGVIDASELRPLSSTSSQEAPDVTDPLLADEPPAADGGSVKSLPHSVIPQVNGGESTATRADSSSGPTPAALLISTTPTIEPRPSSVLESPDPAETRSVSPESPQSLQEDLQASLAEPGALSMQDRPPPPPTPPPVPGTDRSIEPSANSCPPTESNVDQSPPGPTTHSPLLPVTDSPITPKLDSAPPCINSRPSPPPLPGQKSILDALGPVVIDTDGTAAQSPTILPVTQIVRPATPEPPTAVAPPAQGPVAMDSLQTLIDCTVSSPIDRDTLSLTDGASPDNNTPNGAASS
ncbi:Solute carrier family 22 member 23 [Takifugu flavidus]|uniref:Solute carrier family 22 member 23 n=1 Tax=Takifugu flavidus TaxID=433684 RepID=A0A5C6P4T1_9TELE|nr:Solute carrier family 22 member 23 [Takifugu flavidus]